MGEAEEEEEGRPSVLSGRHADQAAPWVEAEKGGGGQREKKVVMYKKEREGNKRIRKPNC